MDPIYQKLAKKLDDLPPGFPPTPNGAELRILQLLYTPAEAELATQLTLLAEEVRVIAVRVGRPVDQVAQELEAMAQKGLIYRLQREGRPPLYQIIYFALGIWEFQVNRLNAELIGAVDDYLEQIFDLGIWRTSPQLRTIPVSESLSLPHEIMPYEQADEIVRAQKKILVAPCICRRERSMVAHSCGKPVETCMLFGEVADFYEHNGLGRIIDTSEAMDILKIADRAGLVLQPTNSQDAGALCCCCGDCCGVLRNLNRQERPAEQVLSAYRVRLDPEECLACGLCETRCQMQAVIETAGVYAIDDDRCIGCGLCVTTCATGALTMVRKPESEIPAIPKTMLHNAYQMWRDRGRLNIPNLAMMGIKSKMDRLRASLY